MEDTRKDITDDIAIGGIAVIGMSGRFPGARNLDEFWRNLREGRESVTFFSEEELAATVSPDLLGNPAYVRANAVLDDADMFDGTFFGFSPRESEILDPQHRVFLECAWSALESAGYNADWYDGIVGVFGGTDLSSYLFNIFSNRDVISAVGPLQAIMSNDKDHLCTRVSHRLNLKGPSLCVQSACSTSLVAVHLACRSLLNFETDMALAGGVSIKWPQKAGYLYEEAGISSPDGHCRAFDSKAKGTIGGNGVGIVVLKRLADALADGDCIHAVIKGTAVNNDGAQKISYTAPQVDGQAECIALAQEMAGVRPETITYVEAHGTATALGDTIECAALTQAFRSGTGKTGYCALGSVKTNIGHLDAAAGVAGLIKTILAIKHRMLPPSLHFEEPNPNIDFKNSPFYVNATLSEWKTNGTPRRAGVSSFGMGGTNVHVVLEEFRSDSRATPPPSRPWKLVTLSAKTKSALDAVTAGLKDHLLLHTEGDLADVAYTCQLGRKAFGHRRAVVCKDSAEALSLLERPESDRVFAGYHDSGSKSLVMMFPGQGAQHPNMGLELYQSEKVFREQVDSSAELLKPLLGFDLRRALYPLDESDEYAGRLIETSIAQPALFVIEYALARWFNDLGINADAMIGHSIGEYVAACLAGVFSVDDALRLVAIRGRLMQQMPPGAMTAVMLGEREVEQLIAGDVSIAAVNGPGVTVVSGSFDAIEQLESSLEKQGAGWRRLHTSHAFHSAMMDPILSAFTDEVGATTRNTPKIPFISNVTGTWITAAEATDPAYWARHLRETVRFSAGVVELLNEPSRLFLEVGPGQSLANLVRQQAEPRSNRTVTSSMLSPADKKPHKNRSELAATLAAVGKLWVGGLHCDWRAFNRNEQRRRVELPSYPFERQRYWIEPAMISAQPQAEPFGKKPDVSDWFYVPVWKQTVPRQRARQFGQEGNGALEQQRWLIIGGSDVVARQVAARLRTIGHDGIEVILSDRFAKTDERNYSIDAGSAEDYYSLLSGIEKDGLRPQVVLHLGNLIASEGAPDQRFERAQRHGLYSLLYLVRALARINFTDQLELGVVSTNVQAVIGDEQISPEKAAALGLCRVIPQEYPNIICRSIELSASDQISASDQSDDGLIDQLISEMASDVRDPSVAYRGHRRWCQVYEPVRLSQPGDGCEPLRRRGVYLITGGLGGVGLVLAEHLARKAEARLVLVGRSAFPARDEWQAWLDTHEETDPTSARIRKLREIEECGGSALVYSANVADEEQMRAVVADCATRFGPINGVIHGAGISGERSVRAIYETGPTECGWHFEPKAAGLRVLSRVLEGTNPDFCLLLSSLSAVLGGLGFAAYSSANAYMDAFVRQQAGSGGLPWITVDWDAWLLSEGSERIGAGLDRLAMKPDEGADAFERIIAARGVTEVVVSTADLNVRMRQWLMPDLAVDEPTADTPRALYPRPELSEEYVEPTTPTELTIAGVWQDLLGIERIGVRDNFFDLGGHSLLATQLISRMRKSFEVELPLRRFFENPTVADLAILIIQSLTEKVDEDRLALMSEEIKTLSEGELKELLDAEKHLVAGS